MKKRRVGERSEVVVDRTDLFILSYVDSKKGNGAGVMEIQSWLQVSHNSLKPHIEKLLNYKLLKESSVEKSRKRLLTLTKGGKSILYLLADISYKKEMEKNKK